MPRARISYGLVTSQNQGGGNSKQGLPTTIGRTFRLVKIKSWINEKKEKKEEIEKVVTVSPGKEYTSNAELEIFRGSIKIIGSLIISGDFQPDFSIFDSLKEITENFSINLNQGLTTISGFGNLTDVRGNFIIGQNTSLESVSGFENLKTVGGNFVIFKNGVSVTPIANDVVTTVTGFGNLSETGDIDGNLVLEGFSNTQLLSIAPELMAKLRDAKRGLQGIQHVYPPI
jgi:hypothetical protein